MLTLQSYDPAGSGANAPYSLVTAVDGVPVISSIVLAEGLGIAHRALIATIKKHLASVERFGRVLFQKAPLKTNGGTQLITQVDLNENQALFVGSLSDNSLQVVDFKVRLIEEFDKARKALIHVPQAGLVKLVDKLTDKVAGLENKLAHLTERYGPAYEAKVVADANKDVEVRIRREQIVMYVTTRIRYSISCTWTVFWDKYEVSYNCDVRALERKEGELTLDAAIRHGHLDKIWEFVNIQ